MTEVHVSWHVIFEMEKRLAVVDRARLLSDADAVVPVGQAPDGLPLLLRVQRSASIIEPVLRALHAPNMKSLAPETRNMLVALDRRVQSERKELGIAPRGPVTNAPHYVSMASVPALFGDTLLARLLGTASPLLLGHEQLGHSDALAARTSVGVLMEAHERVRLAAELNTTQHLAVPLDDTPACVVRKRKDGALDLKDGRALVAEDLRRLPSATFHAYERRNGHDEVTQLQGRMGDTAEYREALRRAHAVGWTVSRQDLIRVVAEVARSLIPLHEDGLVHGDIKPANVLMTSDGAVAHDSLDVKIGSLSAAGTKGWNAPEQIIARPVSPATDVFALAQLVVRILNAAVFGDERSFIVPIGRGERTRETLLVEPDVYLDPSLVALDDAAIAAWRAFLRRCLALEADKRVQSAAGFADELMNIAERHRVPGRSVVNGLAGRLSRSAATGDGLIDRFKRATGHDDDAVAWVLDDTYSYVHSTPWRFVFGLAA